MAKKSTTKKVVAENIIPTEKIETKAEVPYFDSDGKLRNTYLFSPAATFYKENGAYTLAPYGSKDYVDFWKQEAERCEHGFELNGIRITGYHYFFLNYYQLETVEDTTADASGKIFTFPRFWKIHYDLFRLIEYCEKKGLHFVLLKTRGCGLSETMASIGARDYTFSRRTPNGFLHKKVFYIASLEDYLLGDGVLAKTWRCLDHLYNNTQRGLKHLRAIDQNLHKKAGIVRKDRSVHQTGGEILGRVLDKADKIRGARGYKVLFEESGAFKNLERIITITRPLVEQGGVVTGTIIAWGTSNEGEAGVEGLKELHSKPSFYNMLKFKNVWKDADPSKVPWDPLDYILPKDSAEQGVGWFIPVYDAMDRFMDKDGNPNRKEAYEFELKKREVQEATDPYKARLYKAEFPFTIEEAFYKKGSNRFNQVKLSRQKVDLEVKKLYNIEGKNVPYETGYLDWEKNAAGKVTGVTWVEDPRGDIQIIEHPEKTDSGVGYKDLYIMGVDSIDQGKTNSMTEKGSELACYIKKRYVPNNYFSKTSNIYVARYVKRSDDERDDYLNVLKLALYYGAKVNIEYSKIGIISYFRNYGYYNLFMQRPQIARAGNKKTTLIGTQATEPLNAHMDGLWAQYIEDHYQNIFFPQLIDASLDYIPENRTKYDDIVAVGLCEIADEELNGVDPMPIDNDYIDLELFGYYQDEEGHTQWGVIPKQNKDLIMPSRKPSIKWIDASGDHVKLYDEFDQEINPFKD